MKRLFVSRFFWIMGGCFILVCATLCSHSKENSVVQEPQHVCPCVDFRFVSKVARPAVVYVEVEIHPSAEYGYPYGQPLPFGEEEDDPFGRFFGPRYQKPQPQKGQGSGFFVSADGYIATNAHVVKKASKIQVLMQDGRKLDAKLVGTDPRMDIALLKVEGKAFPFLVLGDSDTLEVGDWVAAIGSPFGLPGSVSKGIVSARGREQPNLTDCDDIIQSDVTLNPGNSGGPLLNLKGEVVGVNTAIATLSGAGHSVSFSIPINMVKPILSQIEEKGVVKRGFLGVTPQAVDQEIADACNLPKAEGVLIADVVKDSPADKAGIKQGDIILEIDNVPVKSLQNFRRTISMIGPGSTVQLKVKRKDKFLSLSVKLGSAQDGAIGEGAVEKLGILRLESYKDEGVVVVEVRPGSPADRVGLRGQLILMINSQRVTSVSEFNEIVGALEKGKPFLVLVRTTHGTHFITLKID